MVWEKQQQQQQQPHNCYYEIIWLKGEKRAVKIE